MIAGRGIGNREAHRARASGSSRCRSMRRRGTPARVRRAPETRRSTSGASVRPSALVTTVLTSAPVTQSSMVMPAAGRPVTRSSTWVVSPALMATDRRAAAPQSGRSRSSAVGDLLLSRPRQPRREGAENRVLAVLPCADHERESEPRFVRGIVAFEPGHLAGVESDQAGGGLLARGLRRQRRRGRRDPDGRESARAAARRRSRGLSGTRRREGARARRTAAARSRPPQSMATVRRSGRRAPRTSRARND